MQPRLRLPRRSARIPGGRGAAPRRSPRARTGAGCRQRQANLEMDARQRHSPGLGFGMGQQRGSYPLAAALGRDREPAHVEAALLGRPQNAPVPPVHGPAAARFELRCVILRPNARRARRRVDLHGRECGADQGRRRLGVAGLHRPDHARRRCSRCVQQVDRHPEAGDERGGDQRSPGSPTRSAARPQSAGSTVPPRLIVSYRQSIPTARFSGRAESVADCDDHPACIDPATPNSVPGPRPIGQGRPGHRDHAETVPARTPASCPKPRRQYARRSSPAGSNRSRSA